MDTLMQWWFITGFISTFILFIFGTKDNKYIDGKDILLLFLGTCFGFISVIVCIIAVISQIEFKNPLYKG